MATGRAAPTPDVVVLLVFDGDKLSSMTDKEAEQLLEPYAGFMGKVRAALNKPRLPFLIVVGDQDGQGARSGQQGRETRRRTAHLRGLARR